jgi:predicted helicase
MDDEEVFGPVLHTLSFHEAINRKLLTDYRVIVIGVDDPMVRIPAIVTTQFDRS